MKYVNRKDLFHCRRVGQQWAIIISSILRRRGGLHKNNFDLSLLYNKSERDHFSTKHNGSSWSLSELNKLLLSKKPSTFPCSQFELCGGSLNSQQVQTFLSIQGKLLKHCSLDWDADVVCERENDNPVDLFKFLQNTSNLTYLTINGLPDNWSTSEENHQPTTNELELELTSLKTLTFGPRVCDNHLNVIREIIGAAKNLEEIYIFSAFHSTFLLPQFLLHPLG